MTKRLHFSVMIAAVATVVRVALAGVAVVMVIVSSGDDSRSQPNAGSSRSVGGIASSCDDAAADLVSRIIFSRSC